MARMSDLSRHGFERVGIRAKIYTHSGKRTACLPVWTHHYNFVLPHSAYGRRPPASCLRTEGEQRVDTLPLGKNYFFENQESLPQSSIKKSHKMRK